MADENIEKELYLFLDFNESLTPDVLQDKIFLRIANLHEKHPLVQVNDFLYKGNYEHCLGTNLFFKEVEEPPKKTTSFEKHTPIHLSHITTQTKVVTLKPMRVPATKINIPSDIKDEELNFHWDYQELLKKLESGTLKLEDLEVKDHANHDEHSSDAESDVEETNVEKNLDLEHSESTASSKLEDVKKEEVILGKIPPQDMLERNYENLKMLAKRPVRRAASPELVQDCAPEYKEAYELHNMECQVLQPSDAFPNVTTILNEENVSQHIDLERCVLYGLIKPSSQSPRKLTKEEKLTLLTLDNFDNLSLSLRYWVLKRLQDDLKEYIRITPKEDLIKKDEFGRTPIQTYEIFGRLVDVLSTRIFYNNDENKDKSNTEVENMDVS